MHLQRHWSPRLGELLRSGRVLVIYGPRRVGKTRLVTDFRNGFSGGSYQGVGEDAALRDVFLSESVRRIQSTFAGYDLVIIDEAQKVPNIGLGLKLLVDHLPEVAVIATGSSSFELANEVSEPLTGRKTTLLLFPVSILELRDQYGGAHVSERLEELMVFGSYPESLITQNRNDRVRYLHELRDSYLYKDILELENLRSPQKLRDLLTLLAFQIGNEVSLSELGTQLGLAKQTVFRYLDLLEKAFVIKMVRGFSRNLRKEVTKTARYYFYDNGVRNALINNFNPLERRNDVGMLWENLMVMERLKKQHYHDIFCNNYFWRTYDQQEIDLVEERDGNLFGYEFKYTKGNRPPRAPKDWRQTYAEAQYELVTKENFLEFVS